MSKDKLKVEIEEQSEYENYLGDNIDTSHVNTLEGFMGEDTNTVKEVDLDSWRAHWKQMPDYTNETNKPYKRVIMGFRTKEDYEEFQKLIGQKMTDKTKSAWHPALDKTANSLMRWMSEGDSES